MQGRSEVTGGGGGQQVWKIALYSEIKTFPFLVPSDEFGQQFDP